MYTKFVSLITSEPVIQTMLPMSAEGQVCDINGKCIDAADDELFKLTSREGKLAVETEKIVAPGTKGTDLEGALIFEQDPQQILEALLPLYMTSQILRALQEALASELAARMNAMSNASDNAKVRARAAVVGGRGEGACALGVCAVRGLGPWALAGRSLPSKVPWIAFFFFKGCGGGGGLS